MSKAGLQALLHEEIDNGDEEMLSILYYLRGEGRTYSWQEVKEMARTRRWPDDIAS